MNIVGLDQHPQQGASQYNALFLLAYNLIGAVLILTLFVAVIIEVRCDRCDTSDTANELSQNFTRRSGMSLLTSEQRQFLDLRRIIARQQPPKRPKRRPESGEWLRGFVRCGS